MRRRRLIKRANPRAGARNRCAQPLRATESKRESRLMEIEFWAQRWKEGRIGFHEGRANQFLVHHVKALEPAPTGKRVLVPLCGKTEDLAFLAAQGFEVVGVEVVEEAVKAFFAEHELTPSVAVTDHPHGRVYAARGITLHVADFFACTREALGGAFDAFYDRAAIVALPEEMRAKYVAHLRSLLKQQEDGGGDGARGLVITFEYDSKEFTPPPFPVDEAEVRALYKNQRVESVDAGPAPGVRFKEAGITVTERVYLIS
jgi:thiopurine S-methyltransferase